MAKRKVEMPTEKDLAKIRDAAEDLSKAISEQARDYAHDAQKWAEPKIKEAQKWAEPKIKDAQKWAEPKLRDAKKSIVTAAAPRLEAAAGASVDLVDTASHKLTDDVLPRIQKAMNDAYAAVQPAQLPSGKRTARKARKAVRQAEKQLHKDLQKAAGKSGRGRKILGWFVVGSAAAGTGYLLWRRSQPIEDPWAEEYWQNVETPEPEVPVAAVVPTDDEAKGGEA